MSHLDLTHTYPTDGLDADPSPLPGEDLPVYHDGNRYVLVTSTRSESGLLVGRVLRLAADMPRTGDQEWYRAVRPDSGQIFHVRGYPLHQTITSGDRIMGIGLVGWGARTAYGTVSHLTPDGRPVMTDAEIPRVDGTHTVEAETWVRIGSTPTTADTPEQDRPWYERTYDVTDVPTHEGLTTLLVPVVDGHRRVLVTRARRRTELVGRVVEIDHDAGGWLVTRGGDHVQGSNLRSRPRRGTKVRVLAWEARHEGIYANTEGPWEAVVDYSEGAATVIVSAVTDRHGRPCGPGRRARAQAFVITREPSAEEARFAPAEGDTPEVAALKREYAENEQQWNRAIAGLTEQAVSRSWVETMQDVFRKTDVYEGREVHWYAKYDFNIMVPAGGTNDEVVDAARRHVTMGTELREGRPAGLFTATLAVPLEPTDTGEGMADTFQRLGTEAVHPHRVQGVVIGEWGYAAMAVGVPFVHIMSVVV